MSPTANGSMTLEPPASPQTEASVTGGLLRQVVLRHFGSHQTTTLTFDQPITFIVGRNGVGKSTIPEAIEWALTGRFARGVDGGGRGADVLVSAGAAATEVGVELADLGWVTRQVSAGKARLTIPPSWASTAAGQANPQATLYDALRTSEGFLHAVFNAYAFLDMGHADAKRFLLDLLDVRVPIGKEQLTLVQLEAAYKRAFEARRDAKAKRAALQVPPRPADDPIDADVVPLLEAQLRELRDDERELAAQTAEARGRKTTLETALRERTVERDALTRRIAQLGDPHADLDRLESDIQLLTGETDDQGTAEAERAEASEIRSTLVTTDGRLKLLASSLEAIEQHRPDKGCVLNGDIPCKTPAREFTGKLATAKKEIAELRQQIEQLTPRLQLLDATARGREDQAAARAQRLTSLKQERSRAQNRARDLQTEQATLTTVLAAIATLQTDIANCGVIEDPKELATVRERLAKGETVIREARELYRAWEAFRTQSAAADALTREVEQLEVLVEQLGPKGAQVQAIGGALDDFLGRINGALNRFGYQLAIQLEPWRIDVNGRPAIRLSTSERLRVGISLQLALAELTGLQLAVFDNVEWLVDGEIRAAFSDLVFEWAFAQPGRQVLILKASEDAIPPIDGVAVYRVAITNGVSAVTREA